MFLGDGVSYLAAIAALLEKDVRPRGLRRRIQALIEHLLEGCGTCSGSGRSAPYAALTCSSVGMRSRVEAVSR